MKSYFLSLFERREGQISALDGLRAFAIAMVVASHSRNDFIHAGGKEVPAAVFSIIDYLWTGVDLFFVLSGFLIGRILFQEVKKTGSVDVVPFLFKRGFRIWPLYYFICGISLLKLIAAGHTPPLSHVIPDFLFLTNYFDEHLAFGTWSLSIEEQFYIIAAILIFTSRKWIQHSGTRIAVTLGTLLVISPLSRFLTWSLYKDTGMTAFDIEWNIIHNFITTHYDGIMIGLLLASVDVFAKGLNDEAKWNRMLPVAMGIGSVALIGLTAWKPLFFTYSLAAFGFASVTWYCLKHPASQVTRFFSWPGFQVISRLSYGMYLWYRFPLWRIADFSMKTFPDAHPLVQYGVIAILAFAAAAVLATFTYVLIEQPFLDLRSRIFQKKETVVYAASSKA